MRNLFRIFVATISLLSMNAACKAVRKQSDLAGVIKPGEDSNTVRSLKSVAKYAIRYEKAHKTWVEMFANYGSNRNFSKDTLSIRKYLVEQTAENSKYEGSLNDALRAGYDDKVDSTLNSVLAKLAEIRALTSGHPSFNSTVKLSEMQDASQKIGLQLSLLVPLAETSLKESLAFEARQTESKRPLNTAEANIIEKQQALRMLGPDSPEKCSIFAIDEVNAKSLASFQQAGSNEFSEPMHYWYSAIDPNIKANVPSKEVIKKMIHRDSNGNLTFDAKEVYDAIKEKSPILQELLTYDAGVSEGYSIAQHTLMVMELLAMQMPNSPLFAGDSVDVKMKDDYATFLPVLLFMHDIGKGVPVKTWGDKSFQHEFTIPVLENMMCQMGFSRREVTMASRMVGHDLFGDVAKNSKSSAALAERFAEKFNTVSKSIAQSLNIPQIDFFDMQYLLYISDAGSYPFVRNFMCQSDAGAVDLEVGDIRQLRDIVLDKGVQPKSSYKFANCTRPSFRLTDE